MKPRNARCSPDGNGPGHGRVPRAGGAVVARWGVALGTLGVLLLGPIAGPTPPAAAGSGVVTAAASTGALTAGEHAAGEHAAGEHGEHGEHGEQGDDHHGSSLLEQLAHVAIGGFVVIGGGLALWRERRAARRSREAGTSDAGSAPHER